MDTHTHTHTYIRMDIEQTHMRTCIGTGRQTCARVLVSVCVFVCVITHR